MLADLKKNNDRSLEIWADQFCIAKIFKDDEEMWNIMTMTEYLTLPNYGEVMIWAAKKNLCL